MAGFPGKATRAANMSPTWRGSSRSRVGMSSSRARSPSPRFRPSPMRTAPSARFARPTRRPKSWRGSPTASSMSGAVRRCGKAMHPSSAIGISPGCHMTAKPIAGSIPPGSYPREMGPESSFELKPARATILRAPAFSLFPFAFERPYFSFRAYGHVAPERPREGGCKDDGRAGVYRRADRLALCHRHGPDCGKLRRLAAHPRRSRRRSRPWRQGCPFWAVRRHALPREARCRRADGSPRLLLPQAYGLQPAAAKRRPNQLGAARHPRQRGRRLEPAPLQRGLGGRVVGRIGGAIIPVSPGIRTNPTSTSTGGGATPIAAAVRSSPERRRRRTGRTGLPGPHTDPVLVPVLVRVFLVPVGVIVPVAVLVPIFVPVVVLVRVRAPGPVIFQALVIPRRAGRRP